MAYKSKYTGKQVDDLLTRIEEVGDLGDNTIIVDYDRIAELKASEEGDDVTHPEIAELVEKIYNEQEKLILVRHFGDTHEQLDPTYFVPDTNYGRDEFGNVIITLFASYTPNYNTYGEQSLHNLEISITQIGAILRVEQKRVTLLNEESVIDHLNGYYNDRPLSARQGVMLDKNKVGYAEYDSEKKAIMLYSDNTKKYQLGEIPIDSLVEEGYYPKMTVGMSDNLVGRGDVQDAQINFRPSAGADNITDGAARIERIKGNSVVWNNFGKIATFISANTGKLHEGAHIVQGHKYLFYRTNTSGTLVLIQNVDGTEKYDCKITEGKNYVFYTALYSLSFPNISLFNPSGLDDKIILADLTQMFSAGNEPTSYEEYLQRKPMNIADEFAYNEGELIDMKVDSLVSVGDNAWDEEWEKGTFNTTTGDNINNSNANKQIRSKNLIKVLPNTTYTCTIPAKIGGDSIWCMLLDKDKEVITGYKVPNTGSSGNSFGLKIAAPTFTTPANAAYLKFYCPIIYGDVYTKDICFHLEHSEYKNGKYYPYQQEVKDLSFIGEAFQEGMRSAGSAFDEIRFNPTKKVWEKVTRIAVVDLGSLGIAYTPTTDSQPYGLFFVDMADMKSSSPLRTNRYVGSGAPSIDKSIWASNQRLYIVDSSYSDATTFKQAMQEQGVILYYELATPIVEEIDLSPNFNPDYLAWDFGTEEAIASQPSAPFRADINYEPNAVDDLRWAVAEIRKLKAQLAEVQASVTNLTE